MNLSRFKCAAVGALSLTLLGCASTDTLKTKGLLSAAQGKDPIGASGTSSHPSAAELEANLHHAQDLRKAGDFQSAANILSQLVLVSPDDASVLGEYSKALIGLGRSDDALAFVERAIELQPEDWSLYSARGVALDQKGDHRNAQMSFDRALALKPGDPTVLSNAALSHMQAGDLAGAEKLLLEAAQTGSEYPRIASNLALVRSLRNSRAPSPPAQAAATEGSRRGSPTASAVLPAPTPQGAAPIVQLSGTPAVVLPSSTERRKTDPDVRRQPVLNDQKSGPAVAKKLPAKDAPPAPADSVLAALLLRPALSEGRPVQPASVQIRQSQ